MPRQMPREWRNLRRCRAKCRESGATCGLCGSRWITLLPVARCSTSSSVVRIECSPPGERITCASTHREGDELSNQVRLGERMLHAQSARRNRLASHFGGMPTDAATPLYIAKRKKLAKGNGKTKTSLRSICHSNYRNKK